MSNLASPTAPVAYPVPRTVEIALVRRGVAATAGGAHQKLLRVRDELGAIGECFALVGAWDRVVWFTHPFEMAIRGGAPPRLEDALTDAARKDAADNPYLTLLALDLDDGAVARQAERAICDEIATKQRLLWAVRARHGRAS